MDAAELKIKITTEVNKSVEDLKKVEAQTNQLAKTSVDASGKITAANTRIVDSNEKTGRSFEGLRGGVNQGIRALTGFAGPAALVTAGVAALAIAVYEHTKKLSLQEQAQRNINAAMGDAAAAVSGEIASLQALIAIAKNTELSYDARTQAIKTLNKEMPQLNGYLNLENINTAAVTASINQQIDAIKRRSQAKALEKLIDKESEKIAESAAKGFAGQKSTFEDILSKSTKAIGLPGLFAIDENANRKFRAGIADSKQLIDEYSKKLLELKTIQANNGELFQPKALKTTVAKAPLIKAPKGDAKKAGKEDAGEYMKGITEEFTTKPIRFLNALEPTGGNVLPQMPAPPTNVNPYQQWLDSILLSNQALKDQAEIVTGTLMPVFDSVVDAVVQGNQKIGDIFASALKGIIAQLIKAAALAAVLSLISGGASGAKGGFNFLSGFKGILSGKVPGFAQGGIVPGGYPNDSYPAMLTSGEAVVPAHKLPSFVGGGNQRIEIIGHSVQRGEDIYTSWERAGSRRGRIG